MRPERRFHLLVATLAFAVAITSLIELTYQSRPELVRRWLHPLVRAWAMLAAPLDARHPMSRMGPWVTNQSLSTEDSFKDGPLMVVPFGSNRSASDMLRVEQLLEAHPIVDDVSKSLGLSAVRPITIYIVQNPSAYQQALTQLGVSASLAQVTKDTGGFTVGQSIVIPMYQNSLDGDLINTLGHELTHAVLNGSIDSIPSWVNEGLAVTDGMNEEAKMDNPIYYEGYSRRQVENVLAAARTGQLRPLIDDENTALDGNGTYDLELQDWIAVNDLMREDGGDAVRAYLKDLENGTSPPEAFQKQFHMEEKEFSSKLSASLYRNAALPDSGVDLRFTTDGTFHGYLRVLQHGTQTWRGVKMNRGNTEFEVTPQGELLGHTNTEQTTQDPNSPDDQTLFVNLDSTGSLVYQGQVVKDSGFALDYHYGMYSFIDSWMTFDSGKTVYSHDPSVLGVRLVACDELEPNPVLALVGTTD